MYKEGAVCFREAVGPGNLLNLGSEFPEVIMVCNSGVIAFISAAGQTITKDPIVYTAVTASDSNLDMTAALLPFLLGGVKKLPDLFASEASKIYFSKICEALGRSWSTHLMTSVSASSGLEAFRLHNVLRAFT